ncbi:DUF3429 domain-containing protein [Sphingobium sp. HWE2-09]|uniref:DUF3429 domain-containing protein n=1 Tax=Sphingobium sp. HWE2-09 TaxID=3108390 RepID=UPI002DD260D3|nr:DUF3429 domain-containing protein [Sphingobium sp. HWE2-09]
MKEYSSSRPKDKVPLDSVIFGYGPMLPFLAAAVGVWLMPPPWPGVARDLVILWGALILAFVAGVRRGFGFGDPAASTSAAIATMLLYFLPAGIALVLHWADQPILALAVLIAGYALVAMFDAHAAKAGDAPAHFARIRPSQMMIAIGGLAAVLAHSWT